MRVLIAEDNLDSRELVNDIVQSLGFATTLAENGQVALDLLRADPPDLVILDINMPELDGFQVLEAIKQNPQTAKIPVIMLTAQTDVDSRVTGLGLGADDYLSKPFHPRELIARIETRIRAKELADGLLEQQEQIRRTFERFVSHEIVERLLADPSRVELGGEVRDVTVLFADLAGFTPLAEMADPVLLLEALNRYHALLVERIQANGGTVDKFIGDSVMALYNAPLDQADHALRAVQTALDVHTRLPEFHQQLEPGFRLDVNFGIHSGPAIVGNIGTPELMDYTAIGDTVNTASRLQGLSEHNQIMISEATYRLVAERVIAIHGGPRAVRGREVPVNTYLVQALR